MTESNTLPEPSASILLGYLSLLTQSASLAPGWQLSPHQYYWEGKTHTVEFLYPVPADGAAIRLRLTGQRYVWWKHDGECFTFRGEAEFSV